MFKFLTKFILWMGDGPEIKRNAISVFAKYLDSNNLMKKKKKEKFKIRFEAVCVYLMLIC